MRNTGLMVLPALEFSCGAVDLGKRIKRNHLLDRETAGHDVVDEQRDELLRHAIALDNAAHGPAVLQERRLKRNFGAFARAAEQDAGAGRDQAINRFAEHSGKCGGLKRIAGAKARDLPDFRHDIAAVAVIDRVGGANIARQREPVLMHVDSDDRIAAGNLCRHQAREADSADPKHDEAIARARLHHIKHGTGAGLSAAGERTHALDRGIVSYLHGEALIGDGKITE